VRHQPDLPLAWKKIKQALTGSESWKLWLVIVLMPVNWGLETCKWYLLVNRMQSLSFMKSFESVLSGLSLAINTPNRIGEYGGRVVYLLPENRLKGVALTIISSVSQLLITLVLGWVAMIVLKKHLNQVELGGTHFSGILFTGFQYSVLIFVVVTGLFFFKMEWLVNLIKRIPLFKTKLSFIAVLENLGTSLYLQILFYSFLRFLVFALQYVLLWQVLQVDIGLWQGFWAIALVFLIMAIIPGFAIADVGIRGKVAISIVGIFSANSIAILAGTAGLWLLNLVVPALTGSLLLLTIKIFKDR
jgi:hypothetical protein